MTKIVCISDTHDRQYKDLAKEEGDILIHAGDFSMIGRIGETKRFLEWFNSRPQKHKILICGNHDWIGEKEPNLFEEMLKEYPDIIYLNDSGVEIEGLKIWGSPVQPEFCDWAFNRQRGEKIRKHWDLIPNNTDILVTHGPCYMLLDDVFGRRVGCKDLLNKVLKVKPKLHVCGHIHCDRGETSFQDIKFVNASIVNEAYQAVYDPIVVEL